MGVVSYIFPLNIKKKMLLIERYAQTSQAVLDATGIIGLTSSCLGQPQKDLPLLKCLPLKYIF